MSYFYGKTAAALYSTTRGCNYNNIIANNGSVVENKDGTVSVFTSTGPLALNKFCCEVLKVGYTFNLNTQKCMWSTIVPTIAAQSIQTTTPCSLDSFKLTLNPNGNNGSLFYIGNGGDGVQSNEKCSLNIEFDYLIKVSCESLTSILNGGAVAKPMATTTIQTTQLLSDAQNVQCEALAKKISALKQTISTTSYSITCTQDVPSTPQVVTQKALQPFTRTGFGLYEFDLADYITETLCLTDSGLNEWSKILGSRNNAFLAGDPNSYTCTDFNKLKEKNTTTLAAGNPELYFICTTPFGTKTKLMNQLKQLESQYTGCLQASTVTTTTLAAQQTVVATSETTCGTPIDTLENLDISVTLDYVDSTQNLVTVATYPLLAQIGTGNLYTYLTNNEESGFLVCGEPNSGEIANGITGCTPLYLDSTSEDNVFSCSGLITNILDGLFLESNLDKPTFDSLLNKNALASKWLRYNVVVSDEAILAQIANKNIKITIKVNSSCGEFCILLDNIQLNKVCTMVSETNMFISSSPGFDLTRVIDNKKSWVANTTPENRPFSITNTLSTNAIRQTNYDVNDERLVINTKEIDLDIDIASAIETDVYCYVYENPCLLTGTTVSDTDCGCNLLECYEDVFNIISYSDAVDSGLIPNPIDPEDLFLYGRSVRDAWLKAWNELMLATGPYLDIKNGIYYPNPSPDVMEKYFITQAAWRKALNEFNLASGGGFIEGLTVDEELNGNIRDAYVQNTYNNYENLAPQMFNTKCGRIFKRNNQDGYMYFVETPEKELKVFWAFEDFGPRNTTWIDLTSLVQEDYPSNLNWGGKTPEKASYFCNRMMPINYQTWIQMNSFHYQTDGNTSHDEWVNPVEDSFFIEWDSVKGKCMTNMFKEVVPEQFSMQYPITSKNFWYKLTEGDYTPTEAQCNLDIYFRNSGSTACTSCCFIDWTWPNIAGEIDGVYRAYRDSNLKLTNQIKLTEKTEQYNLYIIDPTTNMIPDETSGYIPVKVTTTVRKGSHDGDIVFKEEYVLNDSTSTCQYRSPSIYGLERLLVYVGITDPNSAYWNPNAFVDDLINDCAATSEFGTLLSGNTSTLPLAGASANGIDRNWRFDENYYVHYDVVNNNTNEVYEVTNNDYNLKDRVMPIVCPTSASTQTLDINSALNSINTHKTKMLSNIQEDLDYALDACIINCGCEPNCGEDLNTYLTLVDFMDDLAAIPTAEEIISVGSGSRCGCDYTSSSTVQQSYNDFLSTIVYDIYDLKTNIEDFNDSLSAYTTSKNIGFCDNVLTQPDITLISGHTFPNNYYYKGNPYKIKGYTPCKASLLSGWTTNNVAVKLSAYTDDITYLKAVSTVGALPVNGSAGNVIVVGTPSSYVGYAWDPTINNWSTSFYNDMGNIFNDIELKRKTFINAKEQLLLSMKPFTWSNNYLPLHSIRLWALPEATYVSGQQIVNSGGIFSPCPYKITTETCDLLPYCGPYKHVYNNLC
jgi:hypothetical protein